MRCSLAIVAASFGCSWTAMPSVPRVPDPPPPNSAEIAASCPLSHPATKVDGAVMSIFFVTGLLALGFSAGGCDTGGINCDSIGSPRLFAAGIGVVGAAIPFALSWRAGHKRIARCKQWRALGETGQ